MFVLCAAVDAYPNIVKRVPFCAKPYGCAFGEILNEPRAVYIKLDDDIVFIKDGSFEVSVCYHVFVCVRVCVCVRACNHSIPVLNCLRSTLAAAPVLFAQAAVT